MRLTDHHSGGRPNHTEEVRHDRRHSARSHGHHGGQPLRTLAVRITDDLRAQLDVLAQLTGRSTTEEIRLAIEHWIAKSKSDPNLLKKAEAVRADIERDAETRRNAIAAIFTSDGDPKGEAKPPARRPTGSGKSSQ